MDEPERSDERQFFWRRFAAATVFVVLGASLIWHVWSQPSGERWNEVARLLLNGAPAPAAILGIALVGIFACSIERWFARRK